MRVSNEERNAMLALIEQWEQSGMRQKDFYQKHNLPSHVFYYWHKRYNNQKAASPQSNSFVQLHAPAPSAVHMEMHLPNGSRIIFNQPVSVDYLKALIS